MLTGIQAVPAGGADVDAEGQHLLISEVMTGGAGASDEFIEIFNPGPAALPLEGLEVVYLSATGTTPSARAAWPAGAASVPSGGHVLIANAGGSFASIADALYGAGIAATGGSVALRIQGASSAIDAVGWGTAANPWIEGRAAPAPNAGSTLERLPGGELGSTQDTQDNLADFVERTPPDPQNTTSPPTPSTSPSPVASPSPTLAATPTPDEPTPTATPTGTPHETASPSESPVASTPPSPATPAASASPSSAPTPSPAPSPITIAQARALPDGSVVTVAGVALTSSDFADGGGYVADTSGGIAVLVTDGAFARGDAVIATGEVDDRFSQRTLRVDGAGLTASGTGAEPAPLGVATGEVGEAVEGRLVSLAGTVDGAPTQLTEALAFDLDDGSGALRVLVSDATGIEVGGWTDGAIVNVIGVVGQRDSGGTGTAGYRVQPRAHSDVRSVVAPTAAPSVEPGASASGAPTSPGASAEPPLLTIADARAAGQNARLRVRGVVTLPSGLVEDGSAVVQDATGAILLRLGDEAGRIERGQHIEASGTRSTKSGMLTLRVSEPPIRLARVTEPAPAARVTGAVGEADEASLVAVRGAIVAAPRRSSAGTVSFEIDDGSGPLRVHIAAAAGIDGGSLAAGAWVAVSGVVGQETTGSAPTSGYRLWPRDDRDLRLLAAPVAGAPRLDGASSTKGAGRTGRATTPGTRRSAAPRGLERALSAADGAPAVTVEATLVAGPWPQLGIAGVLWDGARAAGIADEPAARSALAAATASGMPVAVRLSALPPPGSVSDLGLPTVYLSGPVKPTGALPASPATAPPSSGAPIWVRLSGLVSLDEAGAVVAGLDTTHRLEVRCDPSPLPDGGSALIHGLGVPDPTRLVVGCDGVRPAATLTDDALPAAARVPRRAVEDAPATITTAQPGHALLGLLLAALAALGGFAFILRRRGVRPFALGAGEEPAIDAASGPGGGTAEDPAGPSLTLLPLPRERGSP